MAVVLVDLQQQVGQETHHQHPHFKEITEVLLPAPHHPVLQTLGGLAAVAHLRLETMGKQTATAVLAKHRLFLVPLFPMLVEAAQVLEQQEPFQRVLAVLEAVEQEVLTLQQRPVLQILEVGVVEEVMPMLEQQIIKAAQAALALSSSSM